jgi:hypothetical protein
MAAEGQANTPLTLAKVDPSIFEQLKLKSEEDSKVRQDLAELCDKLEQSISYAQGLLSKVHSAQRSECKAAPPQVTFWIILC